MNFYNNTHPYYCGIDLHAKSLYVCIIDQEGEIYLHKEIPAAPDRLQKILDPYIGNIVVGVECMHDGNFPLAYVYPRHMRATRDLLRCRMKIVRHGANLKAHVGNTTSQYNLPPNKVNLKNANARKQLKSTFPDPVVQHNIDLDLKFRSSK